MENGACGAASGPSPVHPTFIRAVERVRASVRASPRRPVYRYSGLLNVLDFKEGNAAGLLEP